MKLSKKILFVGIIIGVLGCLALILTLNPIFIIPACIGVLLTLVAIVLVAEGK